MVEQFTEEEKKILQPFFTNLDKSVFCLINLPETVKGALFSRYSRSTKSLRRILLDEFILQPETGFKEIVGFQIDQGVGQLVAIKKAEEFYDRVLVGYGDDSVAELGGASIAVEDVSNIATKILEDSRIGLSPLEKSTRYVRFDDKIDGRYRFLLEPKIMDSRFADLYVDTNNFLFDTYAKLIEPMMKFVSERFPKEEGVTDRAYQSTIRAKACDILRGLLPAATLTNVGIYGNGRAFEYLLQKMFANQLTEARNIAASMHEELGKVIPSFVKRANDKYGIEQQIFWTETNTGMENLTRGIFQNGDKQNSDSVTLVKFDPEAEIKVVAALLYKYTNLPMTRLIEAAKNMSEEERKKIIFEHLHRRTNRRHKPGRPFENVHYTFDILANFGAYRDLHRHRMLTQERQDLTTKHGFDTPKEIVEAGFADDFNNAMRVAKEAFEKISVEFPKEAQYVVPMAYKIRWYVTMSLREVYYLTELRSTQQGHPDYRKIAQQIFLKAKEVHPNLMEFAKFVDMREHGLERLEAEKKIDKKLEEIRQKYGS